MPILVSGSIAYDYIMDFPDSFKNHILPDQIHILNVCFVVDKMNKNFGGCAGNIGFTMKLLGGEPIVFSPIGTDSAEYVQHFKKHKIKTKYLSVSKEKLTSAAYITTDKDDNQIIAYYNGAGDEAVDMRVQSIKEKIDFALITPTKKDAMIAHAKECYEATLPFLFAPSHHLTAFYARELAMLLGQADFYIANDYEMKLTQTKTGLSMEEMLTHVEVVITTLGEHGSIVRTKDEVITIKPCPATSVDDPTGAGDAYRAGFFTAYVAGHDLKTCGQVASVAATYAVEHYGTQNHYFAVKEFEKRYQETYQEKLTL